MKQATGTKKSPLRIVVIILAVIVAIVYAAALHGINESSRGYDLDYTARDYIYPAENGRYAQLYDTTVRDMEKKAEYSAEVEECRALAFYYEQAVLEHAYRTIGNDAKADEFAKHMGEYEQQLGSLAKKAADARKAAGAS